MTKSAQWTQVLDRSRQELLTLLQSLTPEQWQQTVFDDGEPWSVSTMVSHLIDGERGMSILVHHIRKGEPTVPEGFNIDRWNAGVKERIGELSPTELLEKLATTRVKTLEVLQSIDDAEWTLSGRHPSRGIITIEGYYETIAWHDRLHTEDIRKGLSVA